MPKGLQIIGFDADDTLWQNESFFRLTQERFAELLADYTDRDHLHTRLLEAERRNLGQYGFGIKGFMLSMIETAIEVTDQTVPASVIAELLAAGQDMLAHPVHLLPHAQEAVRSLAETHKLVLITKGDLLDQERKLAQSGLGAFFDGVEIVSHKTTATYQSAFTKYGDGPEYAMMIGNSLKSDVIPALEAGAWGIYIPHGLTWELEHAETPTGHSRYRELPDLGEVVTLLQAAGL
ncbi:HAD family hydrolase [Rhodophyticola sp. CCM32]|uniref:HAD family hydrolase n=1 Tax=Rhodophyticola sp. CCM32 TaxID=2916397 RepID=UPI00107FAEC7|nr:HAD family hydrolase [Rhodophyticola sp. CCM32]QBY02260.1 HAD family hydrolase [Rhodophyticola sp. CCM32]